ncbi:Smr/MutS family protein [Ruminococcus sp.]|uniref:Smr/MutS family protein n=1 Tax=Ruminococcus sp. TaxID=41978 RepID=UPI00386F1BDE
MPYSVQIDLHGQTVESAGRLLTQRLKQLPNDVREVRILHGYNGGTALRDMVRRYKNPRIERKILGLNQGETTFLLIPKVKTER